MVRPFWAHARALRIYVSFLGQKRKRKYRSTPYSPQRSVRTPKLCPGTALGVLGMLREPCAVRARPKPAAVAPR